MTNTGRPSTLRSALRAAACCAFVLPGCALDAERGSDQHTPPSPSVRVAASVHAALSATAEVRVIASFARDRRGGAASGALPSAAALAVLAEDGRHLRVERRLTLVHAIAATVDAEGLSALARVPGVRSISLDEGGRAHLNEALPLAGFTGVRDQAFSGTDVTVALLDTGVDTGHPDLSGSVVDEACFCSTSCCPGSMTERSGPGSAADDNGHGTHVAGAIASAGSASPAGGAPGVKLIVIKVLDANSSFCCSSDLVAALEWLLTEHPEVDIVNMSLGTSSLFPGDCDDSNASVEAITGAVDALRANGTLVVASSGNDGTSDMMAAPACVASVASVGAVWDADEGAEGLLCQEPSTAPDHIACFSNASSTLDLLAPGARITSTWLLSGTRARIGTSHAAPLVAACAADLLEAEPTTTPDQLVLAMRQSAIQLLDARNGLSYPRLDCGSALAVLHPIDAGVDAGVDAGSGAAGAGDEDAGSDDDAGAGPAPQAPNDAGVIGTGGAGTGSPTPPAGMDAAIADPGQPVPPRGDAGLHDAGRAPAVDAAQADAARAADGHGAGDCGCRAPGARTGLPGTWHSVALALLLALARLTRKRERR